MKRQVNFIIGSVLILLHVWFLFESFGYFRQNPRDLINVVGIVLFAAVALSIYVLLPFDWRKRLRLMGFGLLTSGFAVGGVLLVAMSWKLSQMISLSSLFFSLSLSEKFNFLLVSVNMIMLIVVCGLESFRNGKQLFLTLQKVDRQ